MPSRMSDEHGRMRVLARSPASSRIAPAAIAGLIG